MASILGSGTGGGSSLGILGHRKGGSSSARARRAKAAHRRRQSKLLSGNARHYKGGKSRSKTSWIA